MLEEKEWLQQAFLEFKVTTEQQKQQAEKDMKDLRDQLSQAGNLLAKTTAEFQDKKSRPLRITSGSHTSRSPA